MITPTPTNTVTPTPSFTPVVTGLPQQKIFTLRRSENSIIEFTVGKPNIMNTLSATGITFNLSGQAVKPTGIFLDLLGSFLFVVETTAGPNIGSIFKYTLSPVWDALGISYSGQSLFIGDNPANPFDTFRASDIHFNPQGTAMFILDDSNDTVYQYNLSAWDLSTVTYANKNLVVRRSDTKPYKPVSFTFADGGFKMYILDRYTQTVDQFALSISFDISTGVYEKSFKLIPNVLDVFAVEISADGTRLFVDLGTGIQSYALSTPFDIGTAVTVGFSGDSTGGRTDGFNIREVIVQTPVPTVTPTNTATPTVTPLVTPTITVTPSVTPTITVTPTVTPSTTPAAGFSQGFQIGGQKTENGEIQSFPFSSPFTIATDIGNLVDGVTAFVGAQSSSIDGYGSGLGPIQESINRFPFSTPFTTATDLGDLTTGISWSKGISSPTDGYHVAGFLSVTPFAFRSGIERFPFSTPFVNSTDIGDVPAGVYGISGANSSTDGYSAGGYTGGGYISQINRFPFSSPFATATDIGDLFEINFGAAGISSDTDGYSAGGSYPARKANVDRFPFSSPFTTATDVGDLSVATNRGAGVRSETDGFVLGGSVPSAPTEGNKILRFPFSAPFTGTTTVGNLIVTPPSSVITDQGGAQG